VRVDRVGIPPLPVGQRDDEVRLRLMYGS
jgi:hypothetical protein